jgi:hypothetical protein
MDCQFVDGNAKHVVYKDISEPARRSEIRRSVVDQFDLGKRMLGIRVAGKKVSDQLCFGVRSFDLQTCFGGCPLNALVYEPESLGVSCKEIQIVRVSVGKVVRGQSGSSGEIKWIRNYFLLEK